MPAQHRYQSSSAEADFDNEDNGNSTSVHQDWLRDSSGADCESLSPDQQPELEENSGELRLKSTYVVTKVSQLTGQKIGEKLKNFLRNLVIRNLKSSQSALIKVILVIGIAPVTAILRKAILYNYNDPLHPGRRTVLDFQREIMPITWGDIQVPFHPQIDDMIFIKGDNPHPWLAKVLTIQERAKTAKVVYYVEDVQRPGGTLYVQCQERRQAQDIVSWDSILCHANGEWRGDTWIM
ncbi:hypothetical protein pdam_00014777 [Pocillopora damicornis]|uniref:Uncharacterized protein n=1 Tax=Pocillopora damicornis TaxID=46731 RepID=A0A3M6U6Y5_POCDA|nr:hypothetical protein pdam_00014777 [Pocillopora damicornis]